jgi:signal recognition particle subunit SRP54
VILVVDAMTGQEAVRVAEGFHARVGITGLILTKIDGDARGGAALSIREVTGVPIKFLGTGEKVDAFEPFYPDRLASRILGMGDVLTLIEKAESSLDRSQAEAIGKRLAKGEFDLEDFLNQLQEVKKLGPLSQLLDMIPGMSRMNKEMAPDITDGQMKTIEAMIQSMTVEERRHPDIIGGSRKRRIARGSGTDVAQINDLLVQFRQMQRMMKQLTGGRRGRGGLQNLFGMFR